MRNAHDETWDNAEDFEITVLGPELDRGIDVPREVLARAAPEMARALLGVLSPDLHLADCALRLSGRECSEDCANARAALKKAGVLK